MSGIMEKHTDALLANTEAVVRHNELLEKIIAGASAAAGDKPKATRGKAADKGKTDDDDGAKVDADDLIATVEKVKGWLKEFAENDDDPENDARSTKLSKALATLEVKKVSEITSEATRLRVEKWIDERIAAGRLTEEPKPVTKKKAADDEI